MDQLHSNLRTDRADVIVIVNSVALGACLGRALETNLPTQAHCGAHVGGIFKSIPRKTHGARRVPFSSLVNGLRQRLPS